MSRPDRWTLAVLLGLVVFVFPFRLCWELNHPASWDADAPHLYLWGWAAGGVVIVYLTARLIAWQRKNRLRKVKRRVLYQRFERLIREKKWQEAESVLEQCQRLANEKHL